MLYATVISIHIIACLLLIVIVLIQSGRGGGLTESLSGAESIFGTKTNSFLTRATTIFAIIFFITCLSLAILSKQRSKSLLEGKSLIPPAVTEENKAKETKTGAAKTENKVDNQNIQQAPDTKAQPESQNKPLENKQPQTTAQTK